MIDSSAPAVIAPHISLGDISARPRQTLSVSADAGIVARRTRREPLDFLTEAQSLFRVDRFRFGQEGERLKGGDVEGIERQRLLEEKVDVTQWMLDFINRWSA